MKLLVLGGTGDARALASALHGLGYEVVYSVAGVTVDAADTGLHCAQRCGGFGGVAGLAAYLQAGAFALVLDATHPYAVRISANAAAAAARSGVPLWGLRRPRWRPGVGDAWTEVADWPAAAARLGGYRSALITLGRAPLEHRQAHPVAVPAGARWWLRCVPGSPARVLGSASLPAGMQLIEARGPFTLAQELMLFGEHAIDVLVCKNSGGSAVAAKLEACRQLGLPVLMLARPRLPPPQQEFARVSELVSHCRRVFPS